MLTVLNSYALTCFRDVNVCIGTTFSMRQHLVSAESRVMSTLTQSVRAPPGGHGNWVAQQIKLLVHV